MRVSRDALRKLQNKHPSPSVQAKVIDHMEDVMAVISPDDPEGTRVAMHDVYEECAKENDISSSTVRRYWKSYLLLGELPYETKEREKKMLKKYNWLPKNAKINVDQLQILDDIITDNPLLYLDEIALQFGYRTNRYVQPCTIWRYLRKYLNLSLKILRKRAEQQCEAEQEMFKEALRILLQGDIILHRRNDEVSFA